ncbi:MAG TPA: IS1182 family transposase [Syntrophorhabdales bacterium]|nr:IS1182 family transposase [Syntrophorhabdales bacterium]
MTVSKDAENRPGNSLPGFKAAYGKKDEPSPRTEAKPRLIPVDRKQMRIVPVDVERLIPDDHEARAIWDFVGMLDLSPYYNDIGSLEGDAGRPAYDPRVLVSLWLHALSKGVGSAREIARRTEYDPAFQWIAGMEIINYHTLSDFRTAHKERLDRLFVQTLGIMSAEGLVTLERVAHDGTKIKACARHDGFRREKRIKEHLKAAEEQIRLLRETPEEETSLRRQKAQERSAREKKERMERALSELAKISKGRKKEEARASITDPDARVMKQSDHGYAPSYNLQISTDAAFGVIVAQAVSQRPEDCNELLPALQRIEENFGKAPAQIVADGGYTTRENIMAMDDKETDFVGSYEGRGKKKPMHDFHRDKFVYGSENDVYLCPCGKALSYRGSGRGIGKENYIYRAKPEECLACPFKAKCCPKAKSRSVVRVVDHPAVVAFLEKMKTDRAKEVYKTRGPIAEFTNAWIKSKIGLRAFRLRGFLKVGMETLWACLTYNVQQWIRLRWRPRLEQG